jgi:hypothetical protein
MNNILDLVTVMKAGRTKVKCSFKFHILRHIVTPVYDPF